MLMLLIVLEIAGVERKNNREEEKNMTVVDDDDFQQTNTSENIILSKIIMTKQLMYFKVYMESFMFLYLFCVSIDIPHSEYE